MERQLLTKRNGKLTNLKTERNSCRVPPLFRRNIKTFSKSNGGQSSNKNHFRTSQISEETKNISSMTVLFEERDNFDFTYKRNWKITEKTKNVSIRED